MGHIQRLRELTKEISKILDQIEEVHPREKGHKISYPFNGTYKVTQHFGENPEIYKRFGFAGHFGIDFATPNGTPILAVDDGIVLRAGFTSGNGNFVELSHEWGSSLYLHFKEPSQIRKGEKVKRGQMIGQAGNTGYVIPQPTKENPLAGTHLHFSMKINGIKNEPYKDFIDPYKYLTK